MGFGDVKIGTTSRRTTGGFGAVGRKRDFGDLGELEAEAERI